MSTKQLRAVKNAGIATDEMILAAAMVTSFGVFSYVAVPWDSLLQSTAVRMVDQFTQIEEANSEFYGMYRMWPHQMTNGNWANNASALSTKQALTFPYNNMSTFTAALPDSAYEVSREGVSLRHDFGAGGRIMQRPVTLPGGGGYIEVIFEDVPFSEARKVDEVIDGAYDPDNGRLTMGFENDRVTIYYQANML